MKWSPGIFCVVKDACFIFHAAQMDYEDLIIGAKQLREEGLTYHT
jgi:hypothetical protein